MLRVSRIFLVVVSFVMLVGCSFSGTISDLGDNENGVADVTVTLSGQFSNLTTTTDSSGMYSFSDGLPGSSFITPQKDGYLFYPESASAAFMIDFNTKVSDFDAVNCDEHDCVVTLIQNQNDDMVDKIFENADDIAELSDTTAIIGNLFISGPDVTDLSALGNIEIICGSLTISNTSLTNLSGLENLVVLRKGLTIVDNDSLTNLTALSTLDCVDSLLIYDNDNLTTLGLNNLAKVKGNFEILDNTSLETSLALALSESVEQEDRDPTPVNTVCGNLNGEQCYHTP